MGPRKSFSLHLRARPADDLARGVLCLTSYVDTLAQLCTGRNSLILNLKGETPNCNNAF